MNLFETLGRGTLLYGFVKPSGANLESYFTNQRMQPRNSWGIRRSIHSRHSWKSFVWRCHGSHRWGLRVVKQSTPSVSTQAREILRFVEIWLLGKNSMWRKRPLKDVTKHCFTMGSSWLVAGFGERSSTGRKLVVFQLSHLSQWLLLASLGLTYLTSPFPKKRDPAYTYILIIQFPSDFHHFQMFYLREILQ